MKEFKIILFGILIFYLTTKTVETIKLKHFKVSEFRGQHLLLQKKLLITLDNFAELVGVPVVVSPDAGAMIPDPLTTTREKTSEHWKGNAIDVIVKWSDLKTKGITITQLINKAINAGFTGIGLYPESGGNPDRIRLHLDVRDNSVKPSHVATWGGNGYLTLAGAMNYYV